MAQRAKTSAAKPEDLSSAPGAHTVEGKNGLRLPHVHCGTCTHIQAHTYTQIILVSWSVLMAFLKKTYIFEFPKSGRNAFFHREIPRNSYLHYAWLCLHLSHPCPHPSVIPPLTNKKVLSNCLILPFIW